MSMVRELAVEENRKTKTVDRHGKASSVVLNQGMFMPGCYRGVWLISRARRRKLWIRCRPRTDLQRQMRHAR